MRLIIIRHAQAHCNILEDDALMDAYDPHCELTETGIGQAVKLRDEYPVSLTPSVIYSSPLKRARETAAIFHQRFPAAPFIEDDRLSELKAPESFVPPITQGQWDLYLEQRIQSPHLEIVKGLESLDVQRERIEEFYKDLFGTYAGEACNIVIFTHAFSIQLSILYFLGLGNEQLLQWQIKASNTAMHIIHYDSMSGSFLLESLNNRSHLQTTG
ncbi:histidine phosphatase family protein [Paenibacillus chitinolyticus]|uniref:Histidine phosphatase family protein n=1 Tax=Paenibacillus chitinolyticus TaxID=79263 RepID=A0A410WYL6_9BACL|nr:histidine phosphatase family protein [Paenibacillus chitinolyticus]MCY9590470.1 histidine phosphatase family protein [Paenibacillus chitinolyticus]MCY9596535.1 histidine phosphatase family protein [Paenibacillus chitinolyticus]QAV19545.1 histidine phosphatase family protein [Paenibacillus chitinolyticus]